MFVNKLTSPHIYVSLLLLGKILTKFWRRGIITIMAYIQSQNESVKNPAFNKMEQHALKFVNNCLNTNIYSYLETSGGQSSNQYLNVVHFSTPVLIRHLWQLKTVVFLHWWLIHAVPLANLGPYTQSFIYFITYEWVQYTRALHYTK